MRSILITFVLLLFAGCGASDSPEQHLARARDYLAAQDYPAARIELQNAVRLDGSSAEARALLGQVHLQAGEVADAQSELERAQSLGWSADEVRPALARALLAQGKFADVLQLDPQSLSPAAAATLLASQAMAALSDGQPDRSRELAALARSQDPQSLEAKLAEATYTVHQGNAADALVLIESIIEAAPANSEAWSLKGQALSRQGKLEEARAALDKSIALPDSALSNRITRVLVNLQLQDFDAARADVDELLKEFPRNPVVNYAHGLLLFQDKQYRKAIAALTLAEPAAEQFPLALYFLGNAYLTENDLEPAAKYTRQFVALAPGNSQGLKMLAAIQLLQGKAGEAQRTLQPVLDQDPNDIAALNIAANALLLDDQADMGLILYARIRQLQPDWRVVPLRHEASMVLVGPADGGDPFSAATPDAGDNYPQADVLKILDSLQKKDFASAIQTAKDYQFRALGSLAPYRMLAMIYVAAGQPDNARREFERALMQAPGDPVANQGLAQLALSGNDVASAREYYEAALAAHHDDLTTLMQLAALEARQNNTEGMIARLNQAVAAHPAALEPRLSLASHYLGSAAPDKVEAMFATLPDAQRRSPRVLDMTVRAQLALGQNDRALVTLRQLVEVNPKSADARYLLAMAASGSGDVQAAKKELTAGARLNPRHVPSLVGLAKIARLEGEQEAFERYLATLVELAPDTADVLRLRALDAQLNGRPKDGVAYALEAFRQAPSTQALLELSALQKAAGNPADARTSLRNWINAKPGDVPARLALAADLEGSGNRKAAQAQYLAVLNVEPGNITALNNLAWNLRVEDPKKALGYIRQAAAIAPDLPALLDTLAVIESLNGDHAAAQRNIERALAAAPNDISLRYHAAMIAAARGDTALAIAALEALLANPADAFPERTEAEALLKSLKG
jgi:putative PEP-CTERM system TPR-repeat lipoprotein